MTPPATKPTRPPEKIHALTSLRFFAALFVVIFHVAILFFPWMEHVRILERIVHLGFISVSFFFLLSGYILGVVYLRHGAPVPVGGFFRARFARVYPLFFLTLVLDTPNLFWSRWSTYGFKSAVLKTGATFLANTAMLQAWLLRFRGIDNPNWSLSVETIFYLTFPVLGVALWKLRGWGLWVAASAIYLGGQAVVYLLIPHVDYDTAKFLPLLHLTTFAVGILLARRQMLHGAAESGTSRTKGPSRWLAVVLAVVSFWAVVYWRPQIPDANLYDGFLAPVFAAVIWAFSDSDWAPARLLSAPWLVVLGEASFGLYLFHLPVFHLFERLGWDHNAAFFPLYLALSLGVSVFSFYYFETPVRRWILKRGKVRVKETMEMASDAQ